MTRVVKVGGAVGNEVGPLLDELALERDVVLVHGGSEEIDRLGTELHRPPEYYTSPSGVVSRRSTAANLEVVTWALAGGVQTRLVAGLNARGARAVGLSGADGSLLVARRKTGIRAVVEGRTIALADDLSGAVVETRTGVLELLLGGGYLPVVGPPAVGRDGELLNVDADQVAAAVAAGLHASELVLLTNVPGLLRDPADPTSRIPEVPHESLESVLPLAKGRMRKKLHAARDALGAGVGRVVIAPSAGPSPLARALAGEGTVLR
ncbi:MAG TPA: [LysW]-aminoadipate kinase [Thermoplasmata archaeon]|nr:[LysW]-aminoadipate kinase [Thermoplasmata archaeon]